MSRRGVAASHVFGSDPETLPPMALSHATLADGIKSAGERELAESCGSGRLGLRPAEGREQYVGKVLFVKAGESLSLQFHRVKDESWLVREGRAKLELGSAGDAMLKQEVVGAGASFRFRPGTVHRVTALEDTTILEVSTPQLDDVVRLEDRYGRAGEG